MYSTGYDYDTINEVVRVYAGGFVAPGYINLYAYEDGLAEEETEGFLIYLDLLESELDERDVGQVNLSRSVYLVRISQSGSTSFYMLDVYM